MQTTAERIIGIFGGVKVIAEITGVDISNVHRWKYPKERGGTGGSIPTRHQRLLIEAAKARKLKLEYRDFFELPPKEKAA